MKIMLFQRKSQLPVKSMAQKSSNGSKAFYQIAILKSGRLVSRLDIHNMAYMSQQKCRHTKIITFHLFSVRRYYINLNSAYLLWFSETIWWHTSGSTLVYAMDYHLMVPIHYLNRCWPAIDEIIWIHTRQISQWVSKQLFSFMELKNYCLPGELNAIVYNTTTTRLKQSKFGSENDTTYITFTDEISHVYSAYYWAKNRLATRPYYHSELLKSKEPARWYPYIFYRHVDMHETPHIIFGNPISVIAPKLYGTWLMVAQVRLNGLWLRLAWWLSFAERKGHCLSFSVNTPLIMYHESRCR